MKLLLPLIALTILSGCSTTIIGYDGPCPLRPELEPIPVELQIEVAPHTLKIVATNQLKLKKHIKDLEALSGCGQNQEPRR